MFSLSGLVEQMKCETSSAPAELELVVPELHLKVDELELVVPELHLKMTELELFVPKLHLRDAELEFLTPQLHLRVVELEFTLRVPTAQARPRQKLKPH